MKTIRNTHARPFAALFTLFALALPVPIAAANAVTLISGSPTGGAALTGAGGESPTVSGDGRFVAFVSKATNFGVDSNGQQHVYVRDRSTNSLQLVSRSSIGELSDGSCFGPVISRTGRYVVFASQANNLASPPTGYYGAVFLRDLVGQTTELIAPLSDAQTGDHAVLHELAVTTDGRYVAFASYDRSLVASDTNNAADVFVKDRTTGTIERLSLSTLGAQGNGHSGMSGISISEDGRYVSFSSDASNLVPGDSNGSEDVFVRDRQLGTTERVSLSVAGTE